MAMRRVYFSLSTGLAKAIRVPKGTLDSYREHVEWVEGVLGLERVECGDAIRWKTTRPSKEVSDGDCEAKFEGAAARRAEVEVSSGS